jgi:hypothetical protein
MDKSHSSHHKFGGMRGHGAEGYFVFNLESIQEQLKSDKQTTINIMCVSFNIASCQYTTVQKTLRVTYKNAYNRQMTMQYMYQDIDGDTFLDFISNRHFTREKVLSLIGPGKRI